MQPHLLYFVLKMVILLLVLLPISVALGQVTYITVPNTDNGPAYVFADEGTLNVSLYCEVFSDSIQIQTRWLIKRQSDGSLLGLTYTNEVITEPAFLVGKATITGGLVPNSVTTYRTNFTILNFTNVFNLSQLMCGPLGQTLREFNFGFPGMISIK